MNNNKKLVMVRDMDADLWHKVQIAVLKAQVKTADWLEEAIREKLKKS
uniref:Uncharacterized protein n=1 Tax=viral metagenome TaxID=1070528 RepID=A0A6H1ZYV9_9ZZZZ